MSKHAPKKHATDARDPNTREKIIVFCFTCAPCNVYGKRFKTRSARDRFADDHK